MSLASFPLSARPGFVVGRSCARALAALSWSLLTSSALTFASGCADDAGLPDDPALDSLEPPGPPSDASAGDGSGVMLAVTRFHVGTATADGAPSTTAWQDYGYDLDGLITVADFENHCKPAGGAGPSGIFPDGERGVDNAFGKVIVPLLELTVAGSFSGQTGQAVETGVNETLGDTTAGLLVLLRDLGTKTSYDPLDAFFYAAHVSTDGTWSVAPESLDDPTARDLDAALESGSVRFQSSYLTDDVWVAGARSAQAPVLELTWDVGGKPLHLRVHHAVVTMTLSAAHDGASEGRITGVLDTEETLAEARRWIASQDAAFCAGTAIEGVLNQVRQASDIMADGTQSANDLCSGISLGIGFEAAAAEVTAIGAPEPALPDPCIESP